MCADEVGLIGGLALMLTFLFAGLELITQLAAGYLRSREGALARYDNEGTDPRNSESGASPF